jgi:hypothetical protein
VLSSIDGVEAWKVKLANSRSPARTNPSYAWRACWMSSSSGSNQCPALTANRNRACEVSGS